MAASPQPEASSLTRFENTARPRRLPERRRSIDLNPFACFKLNGESGTVFLLAPTLRYSPYQGLLYASGRARRLSFPIPRHGTLWPSRRKLMPRSRGDVPRPRPSSPSRLPNPSPTEKSLRDSSSLLGRRLPSFNSVRPSDDDSGYDLVICRPTGRCYGRKPRFARLSPQNAATLA